MLLTIKQPVHHGYKSFHDYSPPTPPSSSRFPPAVTTTSSSVSLPTPSQSLPSLALTKTTNMSTPHRGLPPMTLPQPPQPPQQVVPALNQPTGPLQLPAPPQQWQGAEESMRNWLQAKAEEDKRKQEEEKTRQESLRLEQRKIEQDMLRMSLAGGIPPYMIPMVFAGMGGGNLPNASLEWAQHYMAQAHQLQQHQVQQQLMPGQSQHTSPEQLQRGDSRSAFGSQHPVPVTLPSTPIGPTGPGFLPNYQMSPASRSRQTAGSLARATANSQLPRLNTGEMLTQPPPTASNMQVLPGQSGHPLAQSQSAQQQHEPQSSPSIYFHHWQPPTSQAGTSSTHQPPTPSDHVSSPKKRKATGPQQPAPHPTSLPQYTSPSFSQTGSSVSGTPSSRRRGHSRNRSDVSARGADSYGRPSSRHRHTESSFSTQSLTSPAHSQNQEQASMPAEPRRHSGGSNTVSSLLEQSDSRPRAHSQTQSQQSQSQRDRDRHYSGLSEIGREERTMEGDEARCSGKRTDGRN
ncbi:uncharacterized protein EAF01_002217 [Botrytis porri]|uniref:uncharacterized protein n=1 Tax=Botrytis porri TaxID=87229 RepID=UPI0018FF3E56|nr:uncharacterized protein EAF01_002217 [Botrytis porri]KAF7910707.1 hypothetical protein EAF01_002217 [Botrytis porri]